MPDVTTLKNQLSSNELFQAFKRQLAKDFEQSNFPADFVEALGPVYSTILEKIAEELQRHERRTDFNIMQLLYRVDISEAQLNKYISERRDENYFTVIAELIIKRVLQKVVTRHYYKPSENS